MGFIIHTERISKCLEREYNRRFCYNHKLGLNCNLGKNLRKNEGDNQLVKYKDTELYLLPYIPSDYEE